MGIFSWIVVGVISGWLAGLVVKGKGFGFFGNIGIGVIGALIGGWLAGVLFHIDPEFLINYNVVGSSTPSF